MKRAVLLSILIAVIGLGALTLSLPAAARLNNTPAVFVYDPLVAAMMTQVQSNTVYAYTAQLSGEAAAVIGGVPYTITTRHTNSGVPLQQATQFVYEYLQQQGLAVSYHNWSGCGYSNRNVIGVLTGTLQPSEIVLITAHLDDMPSSGRAPGADDNASGSVGVLLAADIMSQYHFARTVRFVLFTGEEQGLCGSAAYADIVAAAGDNIIAVYNMDMIAWDNVDGPTLRLHTRTTSNPGYAGDLAIAGVFTNVVSAYGLSGNLIPIIDPDGITASDHAPFWNKGYPAILAIEDDADDFNAYYHTINDNLSHINLTYFTNYVKASVGTAAHLAQPLSDYATLQGTIVDATNSNPIGQAQVFATAGVTRTSAATANNTGQYTLTLLEGNYQVTASAYGYLPQTVNDLSLQINVTTTQNFSLTRAALYTVTGQVQDALTHGPLSATIAIAGYPDSPIATDASGAYQIALAEGVAYTFHVQASVPGYLALDRAVGPLTANRVEDFALQADLATCLAPGYTLIGLREGFNMTNLPSGWGVINNVGTLGWSFNNPGSRGNLTGSTGNFAIADSDDTGYVDMNTELRTPVLNLSTLSVVTLTFKTDFYRYASEVADVDVSVNGASGPWTTVWHKTGVSYRGPKTETLNLTAQAAGQANVMLRFHYYNANYAWWWQVDDVQLGQCYPPAIINSPVLFPAAAAQSGQPGTVVTYTLSVSNTDSITHTFDVLVDHNNWPTNAATPIGPVAAQTAKPITITVTIPGSALAQATDTATIAVRAQDNQVLSATAILTTTAMALPTVELEPAAAAQSANPGAIVTYTLHVSHTDVAAHTFDVTLAHNSWPATVTTPIELLPGKATWPITITVTVPDNAIGQASDTTHLTVRAQDNQVLSATAILTTTAMALPTVELEPAAAAQSANPGVIVTYTLHVSHTDVAAHTFDVTLAHNSWPATVTTPIELLPGKVTWPITITITIPDNAIGQASDTTHVTVRAQDNALLTDTALLTTTVEVVPAVTLTPDTAAQTGRIGTTVTYTLMLTNTGNLTDTYQLWLVNNVWLAQVDPLSMTLAPQASQPLTVIVAIPLTATHGLTDTLRLTAQGTGVAAFSDLVTTVQRHYEIYLPLLRRD